MYSSAASAAVWLDGGRVSKFNLAGISRGIGRDKIYRIPRETEVI